MPPLSNNETYFTCVLKLCSCNSLEALFLVRKIIIFNYSSESICSIFFNSFFLPHLDCSDSIQATISIQGGISSHPSVWPSCLFTCFILAPPPIHLSFFCLWPILREMQSYYSPIQNLCMAAHSLKTKTRKAWNSPCISFSFYPCYHPSLHFRKSEAVFRFQNSLCFYLFIYFLPFDAMFLLTH